MSERSSATARDGSAVAVVGDRVVSVPTDLGEFGAESGVESATADWSFRCASGDEIAGTWTGVPVADLLDAAGAPDATTHAAVTGGDGYRACVPISTALDGLLAYRRDGAACEGAPRFVAPGVAGLRTVKRVARIEALALSPSADAEDREDLRLGEK